VARGIGPEFKHQNHKNKDWPFPLPCTLVIKNDKPQKLEASSHKGCETLRQNATVLLMACSVPVNVGPTKIRGPTLFVVLSVRGQVKCWLKHILANTQRVQ
jgi:hypothetical protein